MGLAATVTFALCLWVAMWAIGIKALDGMLLALAIVIVAAALRILSAYLPGRHQHSE